MNHFTTLSVIYIVPPKTPQSCVREESKTNNADSRRLEEIFTKFTMPLRDLVMDSFSQKRFLVSTLTFHQSFQPFLLVLTFACVSLFSLSQRVASR